MANERARALGKKTTDAERLLWWKVRGFKQVGIHFRRQEPFTPYIVDFACHRANVIVEVDGSQHGTDDAMQYDAERTKFLEARGYLVLRFWNGEVMNNLEGVAEFILAECMKRIGPPPRSDG